MENHIVVDVEIQREVDDLRELNQTDTLGVACAVVYDYDSDRWHVYGDTEKELKELRDRILDATRVSGYNTFNFDFPVIWGIAQDRWIRASLSPNSADWDPEISQYKQVLATRSNDVLRRIWQARALDPDRFDPSTHGGWKLDDVAHWTVGMKKSGHGADAPKLYKAGRWCELIDYCLGDVRVEKAVVDFVDCHGFVVNKDLVIYLDGRVDPDDQAPHIDPEAAARSVELLDALGALASKPESLQRLTDWEKRFATDVAGRRPTILSEKQQTIVERILGKG